MKKTVNNFQISAFVATEPEIRAFANNSVARFAVSIGRTTKETDADGKPKRVSALLNVEMWAKNDETDKLDTVKKGQMLDFKGYLYPEEWTGNDGKLRNRIVFKATDATPTQDEPDKPEAK